MPVSLYTVTDPAVIRCHSAEMWLPKHYKGLCQTEGRNKSVNVKMATVEGFNKCK